MSVGNEMIANLRSKGIGGFITGSVYFGVDSEKSDIDIVVLHSDRDKALSTVRLYSDSEYNDGVKLIKDECTINLIFLHPRDAIAWLFARGIVKGYIERFTKVGVTLNKYQRHGIHEMVVAQFKTMMNDVGDVTYKVVLEGS
jgi:hypothetical protein